MIATTTQTSAAPSTSAAPARTSHVPATQEADTGNTGLDGFEMPSAADLDAAIAEISPESRTASAPTADAADDSAPDDGTADDASPVSADEASGDPAPEEAAATDAESADAASDASAAAPGDAATATGSTSPESATLPKVPEGVQTRINELTAARRSAEERVAQLTEQLASYQARDAGRFEPDVLEAIDDPATLDRQKTQWSQLHRWAAQNLTAPEAKLGEKIYSTEEVGAIFAQTSQLLTEAAPKRAAYLAERAKFDAATAEIYPWASDTKSGDGEFLHRALTTIPELRRLPNGRLIAADSIVGLKLRNAGIKIDAALIERLAREQVRTAKAAPAPAARAAAGAPAPVRRMPPSAPARPGTVPPRIHGRDAAKQATLKRVNQGNASEDEIAASIAAIL